MRALFDNPSRELLPGMYVRVKLEQAINREAYLVPRDALLRTAEGAHLLAADEPGELHRIPVAAHRLQGPNWIVTQGLAGGERIVVENAAQLTAGQKIKPIEKPAPGVQTAPEGKKG
ncbi:hypothetical protein G6F65_021577 [Rhizopus arrhizus]|nr:hypothetical protein G6F65_021577 [Rhizopus arrhizus]